MVEVVKLFAGNKAKLYAALEEGPKTTAELRDILWPTNPPATWANNIRVQVTLLRDLLKRGGLPFTILGHRKQAYRLVNVAELPQSGHSG